MQVINCRIDFIQGPLLPVCRTPPKVIGVLGYQYFSGPVSDLNIKHSASQPVAQSTDAIIHRSPFSHAIACNVDPRLHSTQDRMAYPVITNRAGISPVRAIPAVLNVAGSIRNYQLKEAAWGRVACLTIPLLTFLGYSAILSPYTPDYKY